MNKSPCVKPEISLLAVLALLVLPARADTFGSGANTFTIDFVAIGNAGNADDAGAGGGLYSSPYGGVGYFYRMGTFEISQAQIDTAKLAAPVDLLHVEAGAHTGNEPAANMQWYEAAAFVNWLNTSTGHQAAYDVTFDVDEGWSMTLWNSAQAWQLDGENRYRHKDAYYFLPSEDEWYKAAYHQNDGVTANYWDYATGSNSAPTQELTGGTTPGSAVYNGAEAGTPVEPADVNLVGGLSPYLTSGQNGNVWEWQESSFFAPNDNPSRERTVRGGSWAIGEENLRASVRTWVLPSSGSPFVGFRVASVPEPASSMLVAGPALMWMTRRRREP